MDHRFRELAPLTDRAWEAVKEEAAGALRNFLAARKLVDFTGPTGREAAAVNTGRVRDLGEVTAGSVGARLRECLPLVELRRVFRLERSELEVLDRGGRDADLDPVLKAARELALAEDGAVFDGLEEAGIQGICSGSVHDPLTIGKDYLEYPKTVAQAVHILDGAGIAGPFAIALGPRCFAGLMRTVHPGGQPMVDLLRNLLDGPVVRAPAVDGAVVLSTRGGDFELVCGEDTGVSYLGSSEDSVELCLEETVTFRLLTPEAAVWLRYRS